MNKPITIMADDFKKTIVAAINDSQLPMFIIEGILKELIHDTHYAAAKQLELDRRQYNKELLHDVHD